MKIQIISKIVDNVYLGAQPATMSFMLKKANIKHVISMGKRPVSYYSGRLSKCHVSYITPHGGVSEDAFKHEQNVVYHYFSITDEPHSVRKMQKLLPQIHAIIDEAYDKNEPILVHCKVGVSRSATVIITWLMHRFGWSAKHAFDYVREKRFVINPNIGFMKLINSFFDTAKLET